LNEHYQELVCRFCFIRFSVPLFCFNCGSEEVIARVFNMEYMKVAIERIFSNTPVLCINDKNIKNNISSNSLQYIINRASIILVREEDVFNVSYLNATLVAMVLIDSYFKSMTFNSIERFAQFYTYSINVLNNSSKCFELLIQTAYPNDVNLIFLIQKGYNKLSISLLKQRKIAQLPPFTYHAIICAKSKKYSKIEKFFLILKDIIKSREKEYNGNFWMMGPFPESTQSVNDRYYVYKLLLQNSSRQSLHKILKYTTDLISTIPISRTVKWTLDIDPIEI
jgi:primosomal protein N' (replication factor Y) (superfamily II helicase)